MGQEIDDDVKVVPERSVLRPGLLLAAAATEFADRFDATGRADKR
jgi:hypothetical protein